MKTEQELIVSLITNTQRSSTKRNKSLFEIAEDFRDLIKLKGSTKAVADIAKISVNMLNKFLSVFKINEKVLSLVKSRQIDSVETIYSLSKYTPDVQAQLAGLIVKNGISSQDVRALSPYIKANPEKDVKTLLEELLASKNIKVSVVKFPLNKDFSETRFKHNLERIVPGKEILETEFAQGQGTVKLSKTGEAALRVAAKDQKIALTELITNLIVG